jgi:hypothetical protein
MKQLLSKSALLMLIAYLLFESSRAIQKIAWGTGIWWGEYSMKWAMAYLLFCAFCILAVVVVGFILFRMRTFQLVFDRMIAFRERLGNVRWVLILLLLVFPVWLFQYTPWGVVFSDMYVRTLVWSLVVLGVAFLAKRRNALIGWTELIVAVLVTSVEFVVFSSLVNVTSYPFSLGWSEGNRMWDYSIMFGKHLYDYPADKEISVLLDPGRMFVGGLPFLFPGVTIQGERFWVGLTVIIPYVLLGFAAFRSARKNWQVYVLTSLWVLLFLKQGPIHPPLVLCAVIVTLLWRNPLWLAIPLIAITGFVAEESRFTWLFAPGMWIGMMELAGAELHNGKLSRTAWVRAVLLGLVGMAGGYFGPKLPALLASIGSDGGGGGGGTVAVTVESVTASVADQPLLWYRLLPNATYGAGILVGLLIATLPLIIVLSYLVISKRWKLNIWQGLAILSPLLAFLVVGLVVSTKIGGGGDLHNMDMFLIGLMFTAVLAWQRIGRDLFTNMSLSPLWINVVLLLLVAVPGLQSLGELRSHNFAEDASWLVTLTDSPNEDALNMIPSREVAESSLENIRTEVESAHSQGGEILFMDQRQLLTFGFIKGVPLVPEYEKKLLMNQSLSSNADYFKEYYADLAAQRFALIISEQLRTPVKDSSFQFGEENNAWVKWVSIPTLCYYEPKVTLKEVGVQLLVPRLDTTDCSSLLPRESVP